MRPFLKMHPDGTQLEVVVVPGSSRSKIGGEYNQRLKCHVAAPPEKGKANDNLIRLLTDALDCPRGAIEILGGETSRNKTLLIRLPLDIVSSALDAAMK
jgi:uncharacterized protein (TIGR00251 family)